MSGETQYWYLVSGETGTRLYEGYDYQKALRALRNATTKKTYQYITLEALLENKGQR